VQNAEKARKLLSKLKDIYIPRNYKGFCNDYVITMEYIEGIPILDVN
jgi:predicted unusual protein kinase regulating ubiquinone biosynthesis (AarF/ABC1/UbiB family)